MTGVAFVDDLNVYESRYTTSLLREVRILSPDTSVTLYVRKDRKAQSPLVEGIPVVPIWTNLLFPFQILREVIRSSQEVVHIQFEPATFGLVTTPPLLPLLLFGLRTARKRVVVTLHGVPPIGSRDSAGRIGDLLSFHSLPVSGLLAKLVIVFTYKAVSVLSSSLVVHSETMREWLVRDYGIDRGKVSVIPHGVDRKRSVVMTDSVLSNELRGKRFALFFGRIHPRKGLETLLLAWEKVHRSDPELTLVVAGTPHKHDLSGEYFDGLIEMSRRLGIQDSVIFTGRVDEGQIDQLYSSAEFVILPYVYSDAASGPLAIAFSFGKPVIASDLGVFKDEIADGVTGILCTPEDPSQFADAIESLARNPGLLESMKLEVKKGSQFRSWEAVAGMTLELWSD